MKTQTPPKRSVHPNFQPFIDAVTKAHAAAYPDTSPHVPLKKGQKRAGSLKGGAPIGVHRSAAQKRLGEMSMKRQGQSSKTGKGHNTRPGPNANGIRPL